MNNLIDGKHNYSLHPMFVAGPDGELGSHSRRAICGGWARALQVTHIPKHIFRLYLFGNFQAGPLFSIYFYWAQALQVAHIPKHIFQILFVWAGQGPYFPNIFAHIPKHICKTWFVWALLMFYTYWAHSPRYLQNLVWLGAFKKRRLFYTYWAQSPRVCIGVCFFKHMS